MRPRVPGMNEVDDAILEFFQDLEVHKGHRVALPPTAVWYTVCVDLEMLERSSDTFSDRMGQLADEYGLLERTDRKRGYYRITDKGHAYLSGDLDAEALDGQD